MTDQATIGAILRAYRGSRNRSARSVSLAAGLSDSALGKIETGAIEPSLRAFACVAVELGLSDRELALLVRLASTTLGRAQNVVSK